MDLGNISQQVQNLSGDTNLQIANNQVTKQSPWATGFGWLGRLVRWMTRSGEEQNANRATIGHVISQIEREGGTLSPQTKDYLNGLQRDGKPLSVRRFNAVMAEAHPSLQKASTDRQTAMRMLDQIGIRDAEGAKEYLSKWLDIDSGYRGSLEMINAQALGGGNVVFKALFNDPSILDRSSAGEEDMSLILGEIRNEGVEMVAGIAGRSPEEIGNLVSNHEAQEELTRSSDPLDQLLAVQVRSIEVSVSSAREFLSSPKHYGDRFALAGFNRSCQESGFDVDTAMNIVRSRQNIATMKREDVLSLPDKIFQGSGLSKKEFGRLQSFFPPRSS